MAQESAQASPQAAQAEIKGTSLWADAWRRLLKNRAALVGGGVVLLMIGVALLADVISAYGTHFTQEETHQSYVIKPPMARSVPSEHLTWLSEPGFGFADADGDGRVKAEELSAALQRLEFMRMDTDGDGALSAEEFAAAPHGLVGGEGTIEDNDRDGDGRLQLEETRRFTEIFPVPEASALLRKLDKDNDNTLTAAELPGLPSPQLHLLGCDTRGRDLLTRLIYGGRISLAVGLLATLVSFVIGVTWGATAGFLGGRVDNLMMRIVDVMYGLPFMFVVILLMVVFGKNILLLFLALGAIQWLTMSRIVRGQVISLKRREFVEAAFSIGVSKVKIIFRHLIPNALGPIIVYSTLTVPAVMLEEAFLSFLGLGVQPPYASWGSLASEGREYLELYPWLILYPGLALAITLLSLNFLGDGLRDALDPQLKKD
jgi:oligopeptide transport system permease protein